MNSNKYLVRLIGLLFLVAMAASIAANLIILPIVSPLDFLALISSKEFEIRIYALLMLLNSISVVGIGVLSYQFLSKQNKLVAIGYIVSRVVESVVLVFGIISILSLIKYGHQFATLEGVESGYLEVLGKSAIGHNWYAYHIAMIILGIGSLPFCYSLWKGRLIPKYLIILGFIGYTLLASTSILSILDMNLGLIVTLPVFLFEVLFGFYLITKGFKSNSVAQKPLHAEHS